MTRFLFGLLISISMSISIGCGGRQSGAAGPRGAGLTKQQCFALLAEELGADTGATLGAERRLPADASEDAMGSQMTETVDAEVVPLRGEPSATVCVAWRRLDEISCDGADCDGESSSWEAKHVVAVVSGGRVTDRRELASSMAELVTEGWPEWKVVEIGPAADALVVIQHDESGDTSLERVQWLTVAGGKLVDQFSYRSGIEGGMQVSEVAHEVVRQAENGRYPIVFSVKLFDEENQDPESVAAERDTCRWDAAAGRYACEKNLLP